MFFGCLNRTEDILEFKLISMHNKLKYDIVILLQCHQRGAAQTEGDRAELEGDRADFCLQDNQITHG